MPGREARSTRSPGGRHEGLADGTCGLLLAGQTDADAEITRRLDEVYADQDSTPDPWITAANDALWREVEW